MKRPRLCTSQIGVSTGMLWQLWLRAPRGLGNMGAFQLGGGIPWNRKSSVPEATTRSGTMLYSKETCLNIGKNLPYWCRDCGNFQRRHGKLI